MNFRTLCDSELIDETKRLSQKEREISLAVLLHIKEIESRRLYAARGYSSLFAFCVNELKYSEPSAQRRIDSARLLRDIPEITQKVSDGSLNMTQLTQAQVLFREVKSMTVPQKMQVLESISNKSVRDTEKILIEISPKVIKKDHVKRVTVEFMELRAMIKEETHGKLKRLQDLLSHQNLSLGDILDKALDIALKELDPLQQAQVCGPDSQTSHLVKTPSAPKVTRYVSQKIKNELWAKAQGRCEYIDPLTKRKCNSTHRIQIEHIVPLALGGFTKLSNLRLYCQAHNQWAALQSFGRKKIQMYVPHLDT